jgi:Asp-tRNA(Asn)/Glu-tRNA(Gln) amidotransferase A subunit family amidase
VVGYKPTFGMIDRSGVKLIAESLDTVGVFARTVSDAALFTCAITGNSDLWDPDSEYGEIRIGFCRTRDWNEVDPEAAIIITSVVETLSACGARISIVELPTDFAELHHAHAAVQGFEAARNLRFEREEHRSSLSPMLLTMLDEGAGVSETRYKAGQDLVSACRRSLSDIFGNCHVLITASATGEAPKGLESTGNPVMNRIWTALHTPCVSVPAAYGPSGLPVGVQIIGRPGDDARALACADWIDRQIRVSQKVLIG